MSAAVVPHAFAIAALAGGTVVAVGAGGNNVNGGRRVLVDKIEWGDDGWPSISDGTPSTSPQVWPGDD